MGLFVGAASSYDGTPEAYRLINRWLNGEYPMPYLLIPYPIDMPLRGSFSIDDPTQGAATGATIRLPNVCLTCGDTYPTDAKFCISCGAVR